MHPMAIRSLAAVLSLIPAAPVAYGQASTGGATGVITDVRREGASDAAEQRVALNDTILVTVQGWQPDQSLTATEWNLKLDGIVLPDVTAESIEIEPPGAGDSDDAANAAGPMVVFRFHLTRNATSRDQWNTLLRNPFSRPGWINPVHVGIEAPEDAGVTFRRSTRKVGLVVLSPARFYPLLAFLVGVILVLIVLGRRTPILRGQRGKAYSLGRSQMAWWFVIILGSYLYLGVLTFDWESTITTSALTLMGISAATALGATMIDNEKTDRIVDAQSQQQNLPKHIDGVTRKLDNAGSAAEVSVLGNRLQQMQHDLDRAQAVATEPTYSAHWFFKDLVSDSNGVSLHRFQNVIWTMVLGGVYVLSVGKDLAMPEFDATLLSLMGISSGTYVGFKLPEK